MKKFKIWTGVYFMTEEHSKKISISLKKYYEKNEVWNKGKIFVEKYKTTEDYRKDTDYYLNELKNNATRGKEKEYHKNTKRRIQIKKSKDYLQKITGAGRKARKWEDYEIIYLEDNYKNFNIKTMALKLNRSWSSVAHKLNRLDLTNYNNWTK